MPRKRILAVSELELDAAQRLKLDDIAAVLRIECSLDSALLDAHHAVAALVEGGFSRSDALTLVPLAQMARHPGGLQNVLLCDLCDRMNVPDEILMKAAIKANMIAANSSQRRNFRDHVNKGRKQIADMDSATVQDLLRPSYGRLWARVRGRQLVNEIVRDAERAN
jgi:hypothetical protein